MAYPRKKRGSLADLTNVLESTSKRSCAVKAGTVIAQMSKKKAPRGSHVYQTCEPDQESTSKHSCAVKAGTESKKKAPRGCAVRAGKEIAQMSKKKAPRGNHVYVTCEEPEICEPDRCASSTESDVLLDSLHRLFKARPDVIDLGQELLNEYIKRNSTFAQQKAIALNIFSVALSEGGGIYAACKTASKFTGFNFRVIARWAQAIFQDFLAETANIDDVDDDVLETELASSRGRHPKCESLIHDEGFKLDATEYVREHGYVKGAPNLTLADFVHWISEKWDVDVSDSTARAWLHEMGFSYRQFTKGIYFDGHEREDVVEHRNKYLAVFTALQDRMLTSPTILPDVLTPSLQPIIRVYHDQSTFYSNADQTFHWSDGSNTALKQKSLGQAMMVSGLIEEVGGYLEYEGEEALLYLEHQTEGYFTNDMFVKQMSRAVDIFEKKYPGVIGLFIFDNAPSHCKKPEDCLNPDKMNVSDGGKQPFMRDTEWNGRIQKMTLDTGEQKGMRCVLEERGVNTHRMRASEMRLELKKFEDFSCDGVPIVEEMIAERGHMCLFIPRFHCELNPIERCWCHAKRYTREHSNGSIVRLRKIVPEGLASVSSELISRFFLTCRDYEKAYAEGHTCNSVDAVVKECRVHCDSSRT